MCVCTRGYVCVCVCARVTRVRVCTRGCVCVCVCVCVFRGLGRNYVLPCSHACVCVDACVCMGVFVCVYFVRTFAACVRRKWADYGFREFFVLTEFWERSQRVPFSLLFFVPKRTHQGFAEIIQFDAELHEFYQNRSSETVLSNRPFLSSRPCPSLSVCLSCPVLSCPVLSVCLSLCLSVSLSLCLSFSPSLSAPSSPSLSLSLSLSLFISLCSELSLSLLLLLIF